MTHVLAGPGSSALRRGRVSDPGSAYLITTVTEARHRLFATFAAGLAMSRLIADPATWRGAGLLGWVVMPDHLHALIVLESTSLSATVGAMKGRTAFGFNRATCRQGHVWQHGFHDRALRRHENLRDTVRYLVANPMRAGLVDDPGNYPFWGCAFADTPEWLA